MIAVAVAIAIVKAMDVSHFVAKYSFQVKFDRQRPFVFLSLSLSIQWCGFAAVSYMDL